MNFEVMTDFDWTVSLWGYKILFNETVIYTSRYYLSREEYAREQGEDRIIEVMTRLFRA